MCGPFFKRAFVGAVAELLVAEKPSIAVRLTEVLTKRRTAVEAVKASCHYCSSKPCLSFGANEPRSLQQMRLCKNHNSGTATTLSKMVLNRDCAVQNSIHQFSQGGSFSQAQQNKVPLNEEVER